MIKKIIFLYLISLYISSCDHYKDSNLNHSHIIASIGSDIASNLTTGNNSDSSLNTEELWLFDIDENLSGIDVAINLINSSERDYTKIYRDINDLFMLSEEIFSHSKSMLIEIRRDLSLVEDEEVEGILDDMRHIISDFLDLFRDIEILYDREMESEDSFFRKETEDRLIKYHEIVRKAVIIKRKEETKIQIKGFDLLKELYEKVKRVVRL